MKRIVLFLIVSVCVMLPSGIEAQEQKKERTNEDKSQSPSRKKNQSPSVVQRPLVSQSGYSWGDTKASRADIGTATNRTCFLTGIAGNLTAYFSLDSSEPPRASGAGVRINASTGHYELYVDPNIGHSLAVFVNCVNVAGTSEESWVSSSPPKYLAPVAANRQCFLTQVSNGVGLANNAVFWGFVADSDNVRVFTRVDSDSVARWYIGGAQPNSSQVVAWARCLDINYHEGSWLYIAGAVGSRKDKLTSVSGATCGLTGFGGHFDANDWSDGVFITKEGNQLYINTTDGKSGWATCFK